MALFWISVVTSFSILGALNVLQMREEDVLKVLAAGTRLGGTNLDLQMKQPMDKGRVMVSATESEENLGEASHGSSCH